MATNTTTATGLVAILRGISPAEIVPVGRALVEEGFTAIEVPMNSPEPLRSIELLAGAVDTTTCAIGAGTVVSVQDVERIALVGARIVVAPNTDTDVIEAAVARGMRPYPGVATPTEAFAALKAGARSLKLFPSESLGISGMKAIRAVLPPEVELLPVGGVDQSNLADWAAAGAGGAGIGSCLYRPGDSVDDVRLRARELTRIWAAATRSDS